MNINVYKYAYVHIIYIYICTFIYTHMLTYMHINTFFTQCSYLSP